MRRCLARTFESVLESHTLCESLELSKVRIGLETSELRVRNEIANRYRVSTKASFAPVFEVWHARFRAALGADRASAELVVACLDAAAVALVRARYPDAEALESAQARASFCLSARARESLSRRSFGDCEKEGIGVDLGYTLRFSAGHKERAGRTAARPAARF